jgi:hypothetical protein
MPNKSDSQASSWAATRAQVVAYLNDRREPRRVYVDTLASETSRLVPPQQVALISLRLRDGDAVFIKEWDGYALISALPRSAVAELAMAELASESERLGLYDFSSHEDPTNQGAALPPSATEAALIRLFAAISKVMWGSHKA